MQLSLAVAWDIISVGRKILEECQDELDENCMENSFMEALQGGQCGFIKLLMESGVGLDTFLSIPRLEQLYETVGWVPQHLQKGGTRGGRAHKSIR